MKNTTFSNLLIFLSLVVYHFLFWQEQMGLNTVLFSVLMITILVIRKIDKGFSTSATLSIFITFITAILVVWHNSNLSKIVYLLSAVTTIGFAHRQDLKHAVYAFASGIMNSLTTPINLISQFGPIEHIYTKIRPAWRYARFAFIPVFIVSMFYSIYAFANPKFAELSSDFIIYSGDFLSSPFEYFTLAWVGFIFMGLLVSGSIILTPAKEWFKDRQAGRNENLIRERRIIDEFARFNMLALKNEYRIALMVICSLNVLLFVVNIIDIKYLWLDFSEQTPTELSQFVHAGTYLLIISILLAMAVLIYFFRNNLNFYKNNQILRVAAYLWVIQNAMLALSVGVRNFKYIDAYGLAYKRIGVVVFLVLTLFGLLTMFFKIRDTKSVYYLLKTNAWALYIILAITCFVNWDVMITRYNLKADTKTIDVHFLLEDVSDKNLFILYENEERIREAGFDYNAVIHKKWRFENRQKQLSWASWNYADYRNRRYLRQR